MNKRNTIHKGVSPLAKLYNIGISPVKGILQGTGNLGLEHFKTETLADTTKMSAEDKAEFIRQYMNSK